jgi:hypothetical protein
VAVDEDLAAWLSAATGMDPAVVAAELELGNRRRDFVLHELADAGYASESMVNLLVRLTGVDERQARALVAAERERAAASTPPPRRDARLAENEIRFRERNEAAARRVPRDDPHAVVELVCECSDSSCTRSLTMSLAEYEWLRQDPWRFVLLPGHEAPAVEDAVERHRAYVIVEKHEATHHQVEVADPRH